MFFLVQTYPHRQKPQGRNRPLEEATQEKKRKKTGVKVGKLPFRLKSVILYPLIAGVLALALIAADRYQERLPLSGISVSLSGGNDQQFLDEASVIAIIAEEGDSSLIGQQLNAVQLAELEQKLLASPYVQEAEVYKNINGVLGLEVLLRKPIARLINNDGESLYMDTHGNRFNPTKFHTEHVALVRGDFMEAVADSFICSTVGEALPVLRYIHQHPFWNAQIAEVVLQQNGELKLLPQVGNLPIEFGYPVRIEEKFDNLMDFYQQAIPKVGWNYYRSINVKFRGQVVAKKR